MTPRLGDRIRLLRDGSVWVLTVFGWAPVATSDAWATDMEQGR